VSSKGLSYKIRTILTGEISWTHETIIHLYKVWEIRFDKPRFA
jgi:hypothetical protein